MSVMRESLHFLLAKILAIPFSQRTVRESCVWLWKTHRQPCDISCTDTASKTIFSGTID